MINVLMAAAGIGALLYLSTPRVRVAADAVAWQPAITPLSSPAGAGSLAPQITASPRGLLLSWLERAGSRATLKFAERTSTGWSAAVTVAAGDDWFVNWADVPSVLRLDDGTLVAHWLQKRGPATYAYDVRLARSSDDGRTWSKPVTPHSDGLPREHGFASLFQMPGAGLGLVWLDGRGMTSADGHGAHGPDSGAMSVRFGAFDRQWTQTTEDPVDLRVCECCPTTAVVTSDGPLVAYRNRSDDEIRDIYVTRLERGRWSTPAPVHADGWKIPACPVNGPMLSARGRDVALAWFTVRDDVGHAYVAFSADAGRTFGAPIRLDETAAIGRVDVALLPDGSAVATWIEFANDRSTFVTRRVDPRGTKSPLAEVSPVPAARASGYPRVAWHGGELVFAWTDSGSSGTAVKTAAAPLPGGRP